MWCDFIDYEQWGIGSLGNALSYRREKSTRQKHFPKCPVSMNFFSGRVRPLPEVKIHPPNPFNVWLSAER